LADQFFGGIGGQVDGDADGVIHPFLDTALHPDLLKPVDIVGGCFVVGRLGDEFVQLFLIVLLGCGVTVGFHPGHKLVVENDVFLEAVAVFVLMIYPGLFVVGIDLAAALVDQVERWLDAGSGLCHQAGGAGRSNGETGNIAASVLLHFGHHLRSGGSQALDERVVLFTFVIEDFKGTTVFGQVDGGTVAFHGHAFVYFFRERRGFFRTVAQTKGGQHIAFGGCAHTCTSALEGF